MEPLTRIVGAPVSHGAVAFKDRTEEQAQLLRWLADPDNRLVTIHGRRGIGKSALAARVAEEVANQDWSVVNLSTRVEGAITVERAFFACAELADPETAAGLHALWASRRTVADKLHDLFRVITTRRILLLLDNLEDQLTDEGRLEGDNIDVLLDMVFRAAQAPILLVTTRVPVLLDPAVRRFEVRLNLTHGLPVAESVALLRELDRNGAAGLFHATPSELEHAAVKLHGVPRALELAVGAMADDHLTLPSLEEVLRDFAARGDVVDLLAEDRYRRLDAATRLVLDVLAVFASPVTADAVQWVVRPQAPRLDVRSALGRLRQIHMVGVDRQSRNYALHPMDADIAYQALRGEGPAGRQALERRVAGWYLRQRVDPPWRSITDVMPHRLEFEHRLRAGDYDQAAFVLDQINEFLVWQGSCREAVGMHMALRGRLIDNDAKLAHLVGYAQARHIGGPLDEAIPSLNEAIELAESIGDRRQLQRALSSLGDVYRALRRLDEACVVLARAGDVAHTMDDPVAECHALLCLSLARSYLGDAAGALEVCERLRELADQTGDLVIRGRLGDALSAAFIVARRWEDAIEAAHQAVDCYVAARWSESVGYARNTEGLALLGLGRVDDAIEAFTRGQVDGSGAESPRAEGLCLFNFAWAQLMSGRHAEALRAAREGVEVFRRSGGADALAGEALCRAIQCMISGDARHAATALRETATMVHGNTDLIPEYWLMAEADRLDPSAGPEQD